MNNPAHSPQATNTNQQQQQQQQQQLQQPQDSPQAQEPRPLPSNSAAQEGSYPSPSASNFSSFFTGSQVNSARVDRRAWDTPPLALGSVSDENLNFALDLLPQSLRGGISAMSSRRPSYTAEFSSRSRLLDLPNPVSAAHSYTDYQQQLQQLEQQQQQQLPPHPQSQHPALFQQPLNLSNSAELTGLPSTMSNSSKPLFESERWMRSGEPSRSIWFSNATTSATPATSSNSQNDITKSSPIAASSFSPNSNPMKAPSSPLSGSILLSPLLGGPVNNGNTTTSPPLIAPVLSPKGSLNSLNDFALETAIGSQRNFRSVSFSHNPERRIIGSNSPPKHQVLTSFYEDYSVDEATDVLGSTHLEDSNRRALRPQRSQQLLMNPTASHSLWFNENSPSASASAAAAVAAAVNRRHSFATTVDSFRSQQLQHSPSPPSQRARASSNVIGSPVISNVKLGNASQRSPPVSMTATIPAEDQPRSGGPDHVYSEVYNYFNNDVFGRNSVLAIDPTESISPASAAALISVPSSKIYLVQFKACRVDVFYIPETSNLTVRIDDLVIVDADRGRDLGKVIQVNVTPREAGILKWRQHQEQQAALQQAPGEASGTAGNGAGPGNGSSASGNGASVNAPSVMSPKQILRYAQPNEYQQILSKQTDEAKAVKTCSAKVLEKNLSMSVLDAEYQWDRRKLTFFYSATHRIDFRDLVRDLFRIYKTRIWMCAIHTHQPQPALSQQTKVRQQGIQTQARQQQSMPPTQQHQKQGEFMNAYPQQSQGQVSGLTQQNFSTVSTNSPWKYSVGPDGGAARGMPPMPPNVQNQPQPPPLPLPQYWSPMMYDPYHNPPPGSSGMTNSIVPENNGGFYY